MKKIIPIVLILLLLAGLAYFFLPSMMNQSKSSAFADKINAVLPPGSELLDSYSSVGATRKGTCVSLASSLYKTDKPIHKIVRYVDSKETKTTYTLVWPMKDDDKKVSVHLANMSTQTQERPVGIGILGIQGVGESIEQMLNKIPETTEENKKTQYFVLFAMDKPQEGSNCK